ncbi:MAG TPA: carboxypeptidase regulatory-like domain-containing protein, partial [Blastocatellia bacterium]
MKLRAIIQAAVINLVLAMAVPAVMLSDVRGVVLDPKGDPVKDAKVTLRSLTSDYSRTEKSRDSGEFIFAAVESGEYAVTVEAEGFAKAERAITIVSGSSPEVRFQLEVFSVKEKVNVVAQPGVMGTETATPTTLVTKEQIQSTPGAARTGSAKAITSYVPGSYLIHNELHVHGGHQVTWLVDGVPIPSTNGGVDVGTPFNLNDIAYLEAQRGSYSVEYGDRTYGIFSIIPRTGTESTKQCELSLIYGNFNLTDDFISFADHSNKSAYYASLHGMRTDYGLAASGPEVLHDSAHGFGGFGSLTFNRDQLNQFRVIGSFERDRFQ